MTQAPSSRRMHFGRYDHASFLTFFAYAAGTVVVPVALVSLARELGFSLDKEGGLTAGGALHLGRTVPMVLAMLLCGFASGWWGMRRTYGWSVGLMAMGVITCAVAPSYGVLLIALMIAGLGEGVIEGLATPFVQDLHPRESGRYINFTHSFWSVGVMTTVLGSGLLLSLGVSWRFVVGGVGVLGLVPAAILLLPPGRGQRHGERSEPVHWRVVRRQAAEVLKRRRFWVFYAAMFVAGGGEFCLTFWCASYVQLHFDPSPWAGGVGTACFAGGMVAGRIGWGYFIAQHQLRRLIILSALAGVGITLFFPFLTNLWLFFGLLFLAGLATAPFWPSIQSYATDRLPEFDSTMLLILLSCAGVPGCGVFTWLMGYVGNWAGGLSLAFLLVPGCYLILAAVMLVERWISPSKGQKPFIE